MNELKTNSKFKDRSIFTYLMQIDIDVVPSSYIPFAVGAIICDVIIKLFHSYYRKSFIYFLILVNII